MSSKFIPIADIPKYHRLLPTLLHPKVASFFTRILQRLELVLDFPLYWRIPERYAAYADDPETQRALRIIGRLQNKGYITNSHIYRTNHADEPQAYISIIKIKDQNSGKYAVGWEGKSVHLFNEERTFWPALGEAVERQCCLHPHYSHNEIIKSSYKELNKSKVDIFDIAGLTDKQREKMHNIYKLKYDANSVFSWIPSRELVSNTTLYAPLQWFSFQYVREKLKSCHTIDTEPLLTAPITTGAATGQTEQDAILAGLLEVIERDAFIIYWLNQEFMQARRIDLSKIKNKEIQRLMQIADDYRIEAHVLYLETDVPVHTIGLVLIDRTNVGPAIMVTAKTGFCVEAMICDLLHDSMGQHSGARNFRDRNTFSAEELRPHRIMHTTRMVYWHDPKQIKKIEHFISGTLVPLSELPKYESTGITNKDLNVLLTWFKEKKYQVLYRELISPELKKLTEGLSVAMVKVPKMQPVYLEESLRSAEGERLHTVPKYLGHASPPRDSDQFHKEPHPFP